MKNTIIVTFLLQVFTFLSITTFAQIEVNAHINGGMILGTPFMEIPEGATGKLGKGPYFGAELQFPIIDKLSLRGGVYYAIKGSKFQSPIEGRYDVAEGILGISLPFPLEVNYTGTVDGEFENRYLDFPIYLHYQVVKRFSVGVGYQLSSLLDGRMDGTVDVRALFLNFDDQEFDQSEFIKKGDQAIIGELNFHPTERFSIKLRGSWGTQEILTEDTSGLGNPKNYYLGVMLGVKVF